MRMTTIGIAAVLLAAGACKKNSEDRAAKPAEQVKQEASKAFTGEELGKWYEGCWNSFATQKWNELSNCYADDVTSMNLGMPPINGKGGVIEEHKGWSTAFPGAKSEPQLVLVSGRDILAVRWFHGTHSGLLKAPEGDIPATNKAVSMLVFHHAQVSDTNQIMREQWAFDVGTLMFQLGKSKDPGRAPLDRGWPGAPMLVVAKDDKAEHQNAGAVKQIYDLWNKRDMKTFYAMLAVDVVESFNNEPQDLDRKAIEEENKGFMAAFSDNRVDVDTVWAAGDYTVAFEHFRGTNDGDLGPTKKTGKKLDWAMFEILKWKDGKVQNSWPFVNGMELATQLGLAPTPGDAKTGTPKP